MSDAHTTTAELTAAPGPHPAPSRFDKGVGEALGVTALGLPQVELPPGEASPSPSCPATSSR